MAKFLGFQELRLEDKLALPPHPMKCFKVRPCLYCQKWRVVHAEKKLYPAQCGEVLRELQNLSYTCGSIFQDSLVNPTRDDWRQTIPLS